MIEVLTRIQIEATYIAASVSLTILLILAGLATVPPFRFQKTVATMIPALLLFLWWERIIPLSHWGEPRLTWLVVIGAGAFFVASAFNDLKGLLHQGRFP